MMVVLGITDVEHHEWYFCVFKLDQCINTNRRNRFRAMEFNVNFKNISVRSWWSLLLMSETGVPGEDNRPAARIEGIYLVIKEKRDE